ncbi:MAG: GNAT family N-acetyltransferase [Chloroflexota bacterium]
MDTICVAEQRQIEAKQSERFRAIYEDSFPPHERAEFSSLASGIASGARWLYTASRDDALLGFAILVPYIARDTHLLEYLAVARDARGGGIGGVLLRRIVDATRGNGNIAGIMLEVEHDEEGTADARALRQRRIAFYARHGARVVDGAPNYRVPLSNRAGTMRMKLLWLPVAANSAAPRGDKLRECVAGIFEKSYGICNGELLRKVLHDVTN